MPFPHKSMKVGSLTLKVQTDCVANVLSPACAEPPFIHNKVPDGREIVTAAAAFFIVIISPAAPNDAGTVSVIGVALTHITV